MGVSGGGSNTASEEKLLSLGVYPAVSLKEARERREEAKEQIAMGITPERI